MMPGSRHPRLRAFALLAFSVSALLPPVCAHAQGTPQIALSQAVQPAPQPVQATAPAAGTTGNAADADQAIPPPQRTLTAKAIDKVNKVMGNTDFQAIVADEIGGGNGLAAFSVGAHYQIPIVDADGMGRAYPSMEHSKQQNNHFL